MPAAKPPVRDLLRKNSPSSSRYISVDAALGAVSRASINIFESSSATCKRKNPPPPIPELYGSTTAKVAATAIAASNALPPAFKILIPALVA